MGNASRTIKSVKKTMSLAAYTDSCERMIFMKKIKTTKAGIKKFLTDHQDVLTCTAIMLLVPAVGMASDASSISITPLQKPMETLVKFVSGPFAGTITVGSLVIGLANYRMGGSQSITKDSAIGVGCGAAMTQVDSLCQSLGITASSLTF